MRYKIVLLILVSHLFSCSQSDSDELQENISINNQWTHLSSKKGDIPDPGPSNVVSNFFFELKGIASCIFNTFRAGELSRLGICDNSLTQATVQTTGVVFDADKDGINDFIIFYMDKRPGLLFYRRSANGWTKHFADKQALSASSGGDFYDIDGDGDLDVVFGGNVNDNKLWWWENPHPEFEPNLSWKRYEIKNSGANKHHDQLFGDFDGDGLVELVFWNQGAGKLFIADIPSDPKKTEPWPYTEIFSGPIFEEIIMQQEGLAKADIDNDGKMEIVVGGMWFKHNGGNSYTAEIIDEDQKHARVAVGQLKKGGRPEVVFVASNGLGRLKWYEWQEGSWIGHDLLGFDVEHGHSLEVADIDGDGNLDIFCAEIKIEETFNPDAKMWVFYGDGEGNFKKQEIATGFDNHESRVEDLDGDGDLDILSIPLNWDTPRIDIFLNNVN